MSTQDGGGKGEAGTERERVGSRPSELSFACMQEEAEREREEGGGGRGGLLLACFHSRISYSSSIICPTHKHMRCRYAEMTRGPAPKSIFRAFPKDETQQVINFKRIKFAAAKQIAGCDLCRRRRAVLELDCISEGEGERATEGAP